MFTLKIGSSVLIMQEEIWKDAVGYEEYIQVSTAGRIRTKRRTLITSNNRVIKLPVRMKNPFVVNSGYKVISISWKEDGRYIRKKELVHRLVATTFLPNPDNLPVVNHKDENKQNNAVSNLEWCTQTYNRNYGSCYNPVAQIDKLTKQVIAIFDNARIAMEKTGVQISSIYCCCRHKPGCHTAGGFIWEYTKNIL